MVFQIQSPQKFSSRIVQEKDEDLYNALLKILLVCFVLNHMHYLRVSTIGKNQPYNKLFRIKIKFQEVLVRII